MTTALSQIMYIDIKKRKENKMKKQLLILAILLSTSASLLWASGPLKNPDLSIEVSGLVCEFCAKGIEKKFKDKTEVDEIYIDLDKAQVQIILKKNKNLSDKEIKETVESAGYDWTKTIKN